MNKSDKYYLKKGKLELSMLEDEENEYVADSKREDETGDLFKNFRFEHTKRFGEVREKTQQKPEETLKMNKDIYNTLHTMGQFLTKIEPQISNVPVKKSMNSAKAQRLEQIVSSIKVQKIELPPVTTKENPLKSLYISKADQIKEINETVNIPSIDRTKIKMESTQRESKETFSDTRRIDTAELEELAIHLDYRRQEVEDRQMVEALSEEEVKLEEALKRERDIEAQIESAYKQARQMAVSNNEEIISIEECLKIKPEIEDHLNKLLDKSEGESILDQDNIDKILSSFFKSKGIEYTFSKELKKHIEKHITAIKNYK